jgi:phage terminase Nu1 subunit (DNA packaging protein)
MTTTLPELARACGVTTKTVRSWIAAGMPVVTAGRQGRGGAARIDPLAALAWFVRERGGQRELTAAKTRESNERADKLARDNARERDDLVSVSVTGRVWGELLRELSMSVCSLADRMVSELGLSADQHQRLEAECVGLLERLRAWTPGG